jgi:hypothetical protein
MVPNGEGDRSPARPGADLTPQQRAVCEALVTSGLTWAAAARACDVPVSNAYYWRDNCPGFTAYIDHLVDRDLSDARRRVKIKVAALAPAAADRLGQLATSRRAKPTHPYQVDAASRLLDRLTPKDQRGVSIEAIQDGDSQVIRVFVGHPPGKPLPPWASADSHPVPLGHWQQEEGRGEEETSE